MKVFVTGATGVIGGPTVARLIEAGHEVRAVSRREEASTALRAAGAEPVAVDLFDPTAIRDAVVGADAIAHLATNVPPFPKLPPATTDPPAASSRAAPTSIARPRNAIVAAACRTGIPWMRASAKRASAICRTVRLPSATTFSCASIAP